MWTLNALTWPEYYHIRISTEVNVTMSKFTEQRQNATERLEAWANQDDVARYMGVCRAVINRLWMRYNNTGNSLDRPRWGHRKATTPAQDRYIRLMHLRDRFRTTTSTASQVPGLRQYSCQTVISRLRQAGLLASATQSSHGTSSRWTSSVVSRTYSMKTNTVEKFSFPTNLASCYS